jgi:hypothetical protein
MDFIGMRSNVSIFLHHFFSVITVRMANKFPNSGTLDYHIVNAGKQSQWEKAHIRLKRHILIPYLGPGLRIALMFPEVVPPRLCRKDLTALKATGFSTLPPGEL